MHTTLRILSGVLHTLTLLLPALIPSWNFFDVIAPSPRIQFSLLNAENEHPHNWQEFRPRPSQLTFLHMLKHLFWNPRWNESLFLVSCAERLIEHPTRHSENEILKRISKELRCNPSKNILLSATHLQFRLLVIQRKNSQLHEEIIFHSRIQALSTLDAS